MGHLTVLVRIKFNFHKAWIQNLIISFHLTVKTHKQLEKFNTHWTWNLLWNDFQVFRTYQTYLSLRNSSTTILTAVFFKNKWIKSVCTLSHFTTDSCVYRKNRENLISPNGKVTNAHTIIAHHSIINGVSTYFTTR